MILSPITRIRHKFFLLFTFHAWGRVTWFGFGTGVAQEGCQGHIDQIWGFRLFILLLKESTVRLVRWLNHWRLPCREFD